MTNTFEAWRTGRPILNNLPGINGGYSDNDLSDWLTDYWDNLVVRLKVGVDDVPRQIDPLTCDERWLDFIAIVTGWVGLYWDVTWPVAAKRTLLANSLDFIWPEKGSSGVLSFVLTALSITHEIQQGESFIIGRNEVGDELGEIAWDYTIVLPTAYQNTPVAQEAARINDLFGPLWCSSRIVHDDALFRTLEVVGFIEGGEFVLFSPGPNDALSPT